METIMNNNINTTNNKVIVGLCAGRHHLPVNEYVFPESVDPTDFDAMYKIADKFIEEKVGIYIGQDSPLSSNDYTDIMCWKGEKSLVVYVTGLSAALAAVIRACAYNGVRLTLMHFNRETGEYIPQRMF